MRKDLLDKFICPTCGSGFRIYHVPSITHVKNDDLSMEYGIVKCNCGEFPVIDGILVTRRYKNLAMAIERIKQARTMYALERTALLLIEEKFIRRIIRLSLLIKAVFRKWPWLSFWKVVTFIENSRYATYLKYRFSCPSFISAMAFIPVISEAVSKDGSLLDLGSGVGHFDFLLAKHIGAAKLVCADKHFMNLYFARHYFIGPGASFVCLDADENIPFRDKVFSAVLSMDAFHYIDKKQLLAAEFKRVIKDDGLLLFVHLHNRLAENVSKGLPLSPNEYAGLFNGFKVKAIEEQALVKGVFEGQGIDLQMECAQDDLNSSDAISMAISKDQTRFKKYPDYFTFSDNSGKLSDVPTILNPLYMKTGKYYTRRYPSDFYEEEYIMIKDIFPEKVNINVPVDSLLKKLIIIAAPKDFMKKNERLYRFRLWR